MGLIFDANCIARYEAWYHSASGKAVEKMVETSLRFFLDVKTGQRALDVGCGLGNHLIMLNRLGLQISGLDASPLVIDQARQRLGQSCDFQVGLADDLPYEDNTFDFVAMIHTLEFLDNPVHALKEAARVARQGIFIGAMNNLSWSYLSAKAAEFFQKSPLSQARYYNLWKIKQFIAAALGPVPVQWTCGRNRPSPGRSLSGRVSESQSMRHNPFDFFLGFYAPLRPSVQTLQYPLRIQIKKAPQSITEGITRDKIRLGMR